LSRTRNNADWGYQKIDIHDGKIINKKGKIKWKRKGNLITSQIKNNPLPQTTYIAINIDQDGPANYFMIGYNRQNNLPFMAYPCTY